MRIFIFLLVLFCGLSCRSYDTILVTNSGLTQGTSYYIKYMSNQGNDYHDGIDSILKEIDSSLSIYDYYSLISLLNYGDK